ncbi:MAG: PBSX family phage terminase large subunit [Oscillospiraceae bacterium]|nr:PBSX family phage terminase large subunit [Oscillospiraceae bacterium]
MRFRKFSRQQLAAMSWWSPGSPWHSRDAVICDGAVRSGKTLCMGLGFFIWATASFNGMAFGLCGKTVTSLRRNVVRVLLPALREIGFIAEEKSTRGFVDVSWGGHQNRFYLFGGRDESSAALIQGVSFAGVLLDEVALMPRSFVEQAIARCSVAGSRLWFNCYPDGPQHWFYREWIRKAEERNALYLRFRLEDNPGLSPAVAERYRRSFSGVFYRRFVLGEWVAAEGLIYDFFDESYLKPAPEGEMERWAVSCDYGTANPCSMGLWGKREGVWYRVREFYFDSRREGHQKTDGEYVADLLKLLDGRKADCVVVDPSAASFIEALRRAGFRVLGARNEVISGIRQTAEALKSGEIVICSGCGDAIREFALYRWQGADSVSDAPRKEHDHAMDDIRYFVSSVVAPARGGERCVAAVAVER